MPFRYPVPGASSPGILCVSSLFRHLPCFHTSDIFSLGRIILPLSPLPSPANLSYRFVSKSQMVMFFAVLRIHDILRWIRIRIRIRGSMPLTNGSGSGFGSGSRIRILLFSSLTFKMPAKNKFLNTIFSAYYFLKLHLHHFSKIKSQKESENNRNQGISYYFCMMIEGSIPLTSGSRSGRPKNMWIWWIRIRIRICNTGFLLEPAYFLDSYLQCWCAMRNDYFLCFKFVTNDN
jgi:hypothetical protein